MNESLLKLFVALAVTEFMHNGFEIWGMRQKVQWLDARMNHQKHGKWPININTALKAYGLHAAILVLITGVTYLGLSAFNISSTRLILTGIILLATSYTWTTAKVHFYHLEIGKLLSKFKRL